MDKVYVVYYDNGHSYEDHDVSVDKIFLSEDSASKYVIDRNKNRDFVTSMTKEKYYSQNPDEITQSFEDWLFYEMSEWNFYNSGRYFYTEKEVSK
jgi:hypothetical protein